MGSIDKPVTHVIAAGIFDAPKEANHGQPTES